MKRSRLSNGSCSRSSRDCKASSGDESPSKTPRKFNVDEQELAASNFFYMMDPHYEGEEVVGELEQEEHVDFNDEIEAENNIKEPDFKRELAKLVKTSDCPSAFTDNLLHLLRKNGHAELPPDTKTLVSEPPPLKMSDNSALSKILENQKTIVNHLSFIMKQLNALSRSHATQRIRMAGLSERMDRVFPAEAHNSSTSIFPIKTYEAFLEFNKNLEQESFKAKALPDITKAMQTSSWLFTCISDDVIYHYNLKGKFNKESFCSTTLFKIIEQNFQGSEFLKERHIQALIRQAHARQNTKNNRLKEKMRKSLLRGEIITDDYYDESDQQTESGSNQ